MKTTDKQNRTQMVVIATTKKVSYDEFIGKPKATEPLDLVKFTENFFKAPKF